MNALDLADKLEQDPTEWGGLGKVAWPAAAMLRKLHAENEANERNLGILSDELSKCEKRAKDLQTECTALRVNEENLTAQVESLRAQLAARVPDGWKLVPVDALNRWRDAFAEELSAWDIDPPIHHVQASHDEIAAMLSAAPSRQAPVAQGEPSAAAAWAQGYRQGIDDERTSEANIGIAGFGAKVEPARQNPYANTTPQQASEPMTDELESALEALVNRCNNDAGMTNDNAVIAAEAALERLYKSRAAKPINPDPLMEFAQYIRRTGDTRLASMAIAVINKATGEQQ